jgi:formate dehydrogenase major subunit
MTNSFEEFSRAKMFLCIGTNMIEAHPVAATFLKNAVLKGAELIVVDPRKQPLVSFATLHVPIKVGSDIAFLNGVMNVLIAEDLYDKEFVSSCCIGFEELKEKILEYPLSRAAELRASRKR